LAYGKPLRDPDYSFDGSNILCLSDSNQVISWKWSSDKPPIRLSATPGKIAKAIYFGDDSVATVSDDGRLRLFSGSGKLYKTLKICDTALTYAQYSYNRRKLAIATSSGLLYIVDPYANKMKTLVGHKDNLSVTACSFSNDGFHLVSVSEDNTAIVWNLPKNTHRVLDKAIFAPYYEMKINTARFSPDGKMMVIAYSDRTARIWSTNGNLIATLMGHTGNVFDAAFTENGKKIYTVSEDNTVRWWDSNGDYINWFSFGGSQKINQITVNAKANYIYAGVPDGSIQVRITAGGIYERIVKSEYYEYFKAHRERYSDIDSQN
jgi:WD40 repeat protein